MPLMWTAPRVERFFNKSKHFRGIATLFEIFFAAVQVVSAIILLT
jgi:hypothetical protein